jgi:hypothetical protein
VLRRPSRLHANPGSIATRLAPRLVTLAAGATGTIGVVLALHLIGGVIVTAILAGAVVLVGVHVVVGIVAETMTEVVGITIAVGNWP